MRESQNLKSLENRVARKLIPAAERDHALITRMKNRQTGSTNLNMLLTVHQKIESYMGSLHELHAKIQGVLAIHDWKNKLVQKQHAKRKQNKPEATLAKRQQNKQEATLTKQQKNKPEAALAKQQQNTHKSNAAHEILIKLFQNRTRLAQNKHLNNETWNRIVENAIKPQPQNAPQRVKWSL